MRIPELLAILHDVALLARRHGLVELENMIIDHPIVGSCLNLVSFEERLRRRYFERVVSLLEEERCAGSDLTAWNEKYIEGFARRVLEESEPHDRLAELRCKLSRTLSKPDED